MTILARVASGSIAAWVKIGLGIVFQIALVPFFLSHWTSDVYGTWLGIQALIGFCNLIDIGHQTYLGNEFLRLGSGRYSEISKIYYSSIPVGFSLGALQLLLLLLAICLDWHRELLGLVGPGFGALASDAAWVLIAQSTVWLISGSVGGIAVRLVAPFGYYSQMAWWGVVSTIMIGGAPVIAVMFGAGLRGAGISAALASLLYSIPFFYQIGVILKKEGLRPSSFDRHLAMMNFVRSQSMTLKSILEMLRQQGTRIVLAPIVGVGAMATFATIRTGANVALQGLGTITNPLAPELMRFINARDQWRCEAIFAVVWLVVLGIMSPVVIVLQYVAPVLFHYWTRGKISYDPMLFGLLSLSVIVYGLAQPAMSVVHGNNLLRMQVVVSLLSGVIAIGVILWLVPILGLVGAAIALLLAEVISLICYAFVAARWMMNNGLRWPSSSFSTVILSTIMTSVGLMGLVLWPQMGFLVMVASCIGLIILTFFYWRTLPSLVHDRVSIIVGNIRAVVTVLSK